MNFMSYKMAEDKSNGCVVSWLEPEQLLNKQVPPLINLSELMLHCKTARSWALLGWDMGKRGDSEQQEKHTHVELDKGLVWMWKQLKDEGAGCGNTKAGDRDGGK